MKTRIYLTAIALITLITWSGNVNAYGNKCKASGHEKLEDVVLNVESWMVNEKTWNYSEAVISTSEMEAALEIENWMVNSFNFETLVNSYETIEIESWMINSEIWDSEKVTSVETVAENNLVVENWMTDNVRWNTGR